MRYWDSSALVPLHVQQPHSRAVRDLFLGDSDVMTWVLSDLEIRSALCRLSWDGAMSTEQMADAISRFDAMWKTVSVVAMVEPAKTRAKRVLLAHPLRATGAMQLGAALTAAYDEPANLEFVTLDERLREAARREGFAVVP